MSKETRRERRKRLNPVHRFLNERTTLKAEEYTGKGNLFKAYIEYCSEKELSKLPYTKFVRKLLQINPQLQHTQRKINGKHFMCWLGIKMKPFSNE